MACTARSFSVSRWHTQVASGLAMWWPRPAVRLSGSRGVTQRPAIATAAAPSGADDLQDPALSFPDNPWPLQRAEPKPSLTQQQQKHAGQLVLNLVEALHWAVLPLGFWVAHYVFVNSTAIAAHVGHSASRTYLLMLGILVQVSGGLCAVMVHTYEGWQLAPVRNPLALPDPASSSQVDQTRVPRYNNSWLRAVAYHTFFTVECMGLAFFTLGVLGLSTPWVALVVGTAAMLLAGPRRPHLSEVTWPPRGLWRVLSERVVGGVSHPVMPISIWAFLVFSVNTNINLWAHKLLFGPAVAAAWPPAWLPPALQAALGPLRSQWWALAPPLIVSVGGLVESYFAESSFDQWLHATAVVIILIGFGLYSPFFSLLVNSTAG